MILAEAQQTVPYWLEEQGRRDADWMARREVRRALWATLMGTKEKWGVSEEQAGRDAYYYKMVLRGGRPHTQRLRWLQAQGRLS